MDLIIRERLLALRKTAQDKKQEGKILKEKELILLLARVLPVTNSLSLPEVMKSDLRNNNIFDALAAWCDPDNGLSKTFPNEILQVAQILLPPSEKQS